MIRDKEKRLAWARERKSLSFEDVIYMDKTTVQIEMHRRTCCYMKGQKPQYKPKPKHPVKVHVWAGISHRGRTNLCIFEGRWMLHCSSPSYVNHLCHSSMLCTPIGIASSRTITPSIVQQLAKANYKESGINWWPTPPESPNLNAIENLIHGIKAFWATVTIAKCRKYIGHLKKVIPEVIKCDGTATGYWRN